MLKLLIRRMVVVAVKIVAPLCFDRRYLRGRHFQGAGAGWLWAGRSIVMQTIVGFNRKVPWPVSPFVEISVPARLVFHPDDLNNFQTRGSYFQNLNGGTIVIGKGTYVSHNVGIITTNHDACDPDRHEPPRDVVIGRKCWIGMNAVVLPGVRLGDHTVVGAGSVVTTSFPEGRCVIGGAPARLLRTLDCADHPPAPQSR